MDKNFWNERYSGTDLVWTDKPNMFVERETQKLVPGTVLDLACGEGRNAIWLAEQGWKATGADFSINGLEKGRLLAAERKVDVEFIEVDATTYSSVLSFELVMVIYLQLPEPARREALRRAFAAVGPGGQVLVVAHDLDNLTQGVGGPQDPSCLYTVDEVTALAKELGFVVLVAEQARRPVSTPDGQRQAIDTVVRAERGNESI
jgi:SAM-dependent methyltransferase